MRLLLCLLAGIVSIAPLAAQDYPTKPIHIIAPFGPGTATDTVARVVAAELTRLTGQAAVVENKPGAEGQIGAQAAALAPPAATRFLSPRRLRSRSTSTSTRLCRTTP